MRKYKVYLRDRVTEVKVTIRELPTRFKEKATDNLRLLERAISPMLTKFTVAKSHVSELKTVCRKVVKTAYGKLRHPIELNGGNAETHVEKKALPQREVLILAGISTCDEATPLVPTKYTTTLNSSAGAVTRRLRLLKDMDDKSIGEFDVMSIDDADYMING